MAFNFNSEKPLMWGAAAAVVALGVALYLYGHRDTATTPPTTSTVVEQIPSTPAPTVVTSAPAIEHPVPVGSSPDTVAAPVLDQSDKSFHDALTAIPGAAPVDKLLAPDNIIRHLVVTVDNLSRKKVAIDQRPLKATAGQFMTTGTGSELTINPENYARYRPFVDVVRAVDAEKLVKMYYHFYPLFQSAFDDLGYQNAYFNDRLIAVIDHLLETPEPTGSIALVQPNVMYLYADPALEALSPGQKTLIRMGPANEAALKARLKDLKTQLLAQQRPRS